MIFALLLEVRFLTFTRVSLHSNILKFSQINRRLFIILQVNARERARNSHFSSRKHIQKENRLSLLEDHVAIGGKKSLNRARFAIIFFSLKIFHHKISRKSTFSVVRTSPSHCCFDYQDVLATVISKEKSEIDLENYFKRENEKSENFPLSHVKNKRKIRMVTEKKKNSLSEKLQKGKKEKSGK